MALAPYITLQQPSGTAYDFPTAGLIPLTPDIAFPPAVQIGDSAQVSDQRTDAIHFTDWSRGLGLGEYVEAGGVGGFADGALDTRFPGALCSPPAVTQQAGTPSLVAGLRVEPGTPGSTVTRILWSWNRPAYRYTGVLAAIPTDTAANPTIANTFGFARFNGALVVSGSDGTFYAPFASADGTGNWARQGLPGGGAANNLCGPIAVYNGQLWMLNQGGFGALGGGPAVLWSTTALAGGATVWTQRSTTPLKPGEEVRGLTSWLDASGRPTLLAVFTRRLAFYNDNENAWHDLLDLTGTVDSTTLANVQPSWGVWDADNALYFVAGSSGTVDDGTTDNLHRLTRGAHEVITPNRGGIADADLFSFVGMAPVQNWLYLFAKARAGVGTGGRVMAWDGSGFHTLHRATSQVADVWGGGAAGGKVWLAQANGLWFEMLDPDDQANPAYTSRRRYRVVTSLSITTAWAYGGQRNIPKRALWLHLDGRVGLANGLAVGTSGSIEYAVDGGGFVSAGTFDSTATWPLVLPLNGGAGVPFKRIRLRITLTGHASDNTITAILGAVSLHYIREPWVRYEYRPTVLLPRRSFRGRSASELRAALYAIAAPGNLATFAYGGFGQQGHPDRTTVANAQVRVAGSERVVQGRGRLDLVVRNLTPPPSG
jgi:hypothetical protein